MARAPRFSIVVTAVDTTKQHAFCLQRRLHFVRRLAFILGRALGLNAVRLENAVGSHFAVGQRLGTVAEGVGQRIGSDVNHVSFNSS